MIGAKERGGEVAAKPIPATEAKTLGGFIAETVEPGSTVCTDAPDTYGSSREYNCDAVNHSAWEYVRSSIHTNSIEGFRSRFKRGNYRIYGMTVKHLDRHSAILKVADLGEWIGLDARFRSAHRRVAGNARSALG